MTAKSHGLDEFSKTLENTLIESEEYDHERIFKEAEKFIGQNKNKALLPLRPIFTQDQPSQWPMVNLRAKEAERAAQMFRRQKADAADNNDMFFDAKEYHTANKQVANILKEEPTKVDEKTEEVKEEATIEQLEGNAWGDEEEIDIDMGDDPAIPADQPEGEAPVELDSDIFVPPSHGADPIQQALK